VKADDSFAPVICRVHCGRCGRTWVFDSGRINPAEYSCVFCEKESEMASPKKIVIRHGEHRHERTAETVEQALKKLVAEVDKGDLAFPFVLEFDGPSGAKYNIWIDSADAVNEVSQLGFMF
jgi:hypothetical protein